MQILSLSLPEPEMNGRVAFAIGLGDFYLIATGSLKKSE